MYHIRDKNGAIKVIQRYLGVTQSGKFDNATSAALKAFQSNNGITVDGRVNYNTFILLRTAYFDAQAAEALRNDAFITEFPYVRGDFGNDVKMINVYVAGALDNYIYERTSPRGSIYSEATAAGVSRLREIFNMAAGDSVDELFYTRLKREIFAR